MELSQKLRQGLRKEPSNFIKQHMYSGNRTYMQRKLREPESIPPILLPSVKCGQAQVLGPRNEKERGFEQQQPPPLQSWPLHAHSQHCAEAASQHSSCQVPVARAALGE